MYFIGGIWKKYSWSQLQEQESCKATPFSGEKQEICPGEKAEEVHRGSTAQALFPISVTVDIPAAPIAAVGGWLMRIVFSLCPTPLRLSLGRGRWDGGFQSPSSLQAMSLICIKPGGYPSVSDMMIAFKYLATSIFGIVCSQRKGQAVFFLPQVTSWWSSPQFKECLRLPASLHSGALSSRSHLVYRGHLYWGCPKMPL